MTASRLIALVGRPGSGKDTTAAALSRHGWLTIAFADALRSEVAAAWRIDMRMLTDRHTKELALPALAIGMCNDPLFIHWAAYNGHSLTEPRSARWVLQRWGTDYRRDADAGYWVTAVRRFINRQRGLSSEGPGIVITDCRFVNEADMVRSLGGHILRMHRPDLPALPPDTAQHASEREADAIGFDAVIRNYGGLDSLAAEVERVVVDLLGPAALPRLSAASTALQGPSA